MARNEKARPAVCILTFAFDFLIFILTVASPVACACYRGGKREPLLLLSYLAIITMTIAVAIAVAIALAIAVAIALAMEARGKGFKTKNQNATVARTSKSKGSKG